MVIVHSKLLVYQRVTHHSSPFIDDLPFPKIPAWELLGKKGPDILMDISISHHLDFLQLSLYKKHHPQSTSCRQESNHDTPNYSIYMHIYICIYIYYGQRPLDFPFLDSRLFYWAYQCALDCSQMFTIYSRSPIIYSLTIINQLVGGFNPSEKY